MQRNGAFYVSVNSLITALLLIELLLVIFQVFQFVFFLSGPASHA